MIGVLKINIAKNMMSATAIIYIGGTEEVTKEKVMNMLSDMNVNTGIKDDVIVEMVSEGVYGREYVIAEGKQPTPGVPGYFEFFFRTEKKEYHPQILEDGSVDYSVKRDLVRTGDKLAEYHHSKQGSYGFTVFSSMVAPIPAKDLPDLILTNVEKRDNCYYAKTNGEVSYYYGYLVVNETLTIEGNATNVTGVITYTGDIRVKGDVVTGVKMKADGNIQIDGVVEGAKIEAGKDIIIKRGIHGQEKAVIKAKGSVITSFIEEADVEAGENISFNYAYNSNLLAYKSVKAEGKIGNILGGKTKAVEEIYVKTLGNNNEIKSSAQIIENEGRISPKSRIIVEKEVFPGVEIEFGSNKFRGMQRKGEFHCIHGLVNHFDIGTFVYYPEYEPVVEKKKPSILLVDDEPLILKTFYSYLCKDYKVMAVSSAKDGFNLMERVIPDLILLDYKMPVMDGGQMLEQIRKLTWKGYSNVPVIFATAVTDRSVVEKCLSLYPQGYLIKPLGQSELLDVVNKFFQDNKPN